MITKILWATAMAAFFRPRRRSKRRNVRPITLASSAPPRHTAPSPDAESDCPSACVPSVVCPHSRCCPARRLPTTTRAWPSQSDASPCRSRREVARCDRLNARKTLELLQLRRKGLRGVPDCSSRAAICRSNTSISSSSPWISRPWCAVHGPVKAHSSSGNLRRKVPRAKAASFFGSRSP